MKNEFENLFTPFYIGKLRIKNRLTVAPMGDGYLSLLGPRGEFSWQGIEHCVERAKGGFGLFVSGCILYPDNRVEKIDPISSSVDNSELFIKQGLLLNERCSYYDMKVFQQITMGLGRNWGMASCSENPYFDDPSQTTAVLTRDDIKRKIECVVDSARLMQRAGFSGVEVHALHWGYLLDNFAMSITNRRNDEYGGNLENRLRVCREIVEGVKQVCGGDFPVSMRLGLKSYMKGFNRPSLDGSEEAGRTLEEGICIAQKLEGYGYDVLNVDVGTYDSFYHGCPPIYMPSGHVIPLAAECKKAVSIPVICGSKMNDPYMCEDGIANGSFDAVSIGRPSLADPDFAKKLEMGIPKKIRPCIGCLVGCMGKSREGAVMTCAVNPKAYLEDFYKPERSGIGLVVVIGGGICGMEAARTAAMRGFKVTLYEKAAELGGTFALASKQYQKADLMKLVTWYKDELESLDIKVELGKTASVHEIQMLAPKAVIIAVGAEAETLDVPGAENCVQVLDILQDKSEIGDSVLVIGGGLTGCETSLDLATKGKKVTLVETADDILVNSAHVPIMIDQMLRDLLAAHSVEILTNTSLIAVNTYGALVRVAGCEQTIKADTVVLAVGMKPTNTDIEKDLRGCGIAVFTAGDCVAVGSAYTAIHAGFEVARNL